MSKKAFDQIAEGLGEAITLVRSPEFYAAQQQMFLLENRNKPAAAFEYERWLAERAPTPSSAR